MIHRAGFGDVTVEGEADEVLRGPRALDELFQIHARFDPHLVQHSDSASGQPVDLQEPSELQRLKIRVARDESGPSLDGQGGGKGIGIGDGESRLQGSCLKNQRFSTETTTTGARRNRSRIWRALNSSETLAMR